MKTATIEWHNVATDGLPEKSGDYLVREKDNGLFVTLSYSAKYKKFNLSDCDTKHFAIKFAIEVDWWAEIPDLDKEN